MEKDTRESGEGMDAKATIKSRIALVLAEYLLASDYFCINARLFCCASSC